MFYQVIGYSNIMLASK